MKTVGDTWKSRWPKCEQYSLNKVVFKNVLLFLLSVGPLDGASSLSSVVLSVLNTSLKRVSAYHLFKGIFVGALSLIIFRDGKSLSLEVGLNSRTAKNLSEPVRWFSKCGLCSKWRRETSFTTGLREAQVDRSEGTQPLPNVFSAYRWNPAIDELFTGTPPCTLSIIAKFTSCSFMICIFTCCLRNSSQNS